VSVVRVFEADGVLIEDNLAHLDLDPQSPPEPPEGGGMRKTISICPSSIWMRRTISRITSRLAVQSSRARFSQTLVEKSSKPR